MAETKENTIFGGEDKVEWEKTETKRFREKDGITIEKLKTLVDNDFLDPLSSHNWSLTVEQLMKTGEKINEELEEHGVDAEVRYEGFMKSPEKGGEITIDGLIVDARGGGKQLPNSVLNHTPPGDSRRVNHNYILVRWD